MQYTNELISIIRHRFTELSSLKEENIKTHIVVNLFLTQMGFDPNKLDYEPSIAEDRADMTYNEKGKAIFLVETKGQSKGSGHIDLNEKDIKQTTEYLNSHHDKITWGLLTNGRRYILLNNDICGNITDKIVFDISIDDRTDQAYLSYYSYEKLFDTKVTNYFADIAQYKYYHLKDGSKAKYWCVYKSTLYRFFDYYSANHPYTPSWRRDFFHAHEALTHITVDDFSSYINAINEKSKKPLSKETIRNSYSYISSFFQCLKENGYIGGHNFIYGREQSLSTFEDTPKIKCKNILDEDNFFEILKYLYYNTKDVYRNIAVFLLSAYYGLTRSDLINLSWDDIQRTKEDKFSYILYNNRKYEIMKTMKVCLENLYNDINKAKGKNIIPNVIVVRSGNGKIKKITESTINDIFNTLSNIQPDNSDWRSFSPHYCRYCLAQRMFEKGYSLEEIMYYVGIEKITQIASYIPNEDIISAGRKRYEQNTKKHEQPNGKKQQNNKFPVHPFQKVVDKFYNQYLDQTKSI